MAQAIDPVSLAQELIRCASVTPACGEVFDVLEAALKPLGFTVTKKIGGAVVRNRMKRRFRALAREVVPAKGFPGADHVMIGRARGIERDFALLRSELVDALERLSKQ